jgi:hypothetical protein
LKGLLKYTLLLASVYLVFTSCRKEQFTTNGSDSIQINADTLWFDTVFTKFGSGAPQSVNKQILIYNPHNKSIRTNITLAGGSQSHFRLNVDGEPGYSFSDVEIFPNDSIFLFVEVHPDKNNNNSDFNPLIIRDSLLFSTNGNEQKVNLIGWGQDAHYIFRDSIESDTTWADSKLPIVVYGYCYIKPDVTLTIEKGMQLHFAPSSWLFVEGKVNITGTKDEPILMQGDRLQPAWEETPGQWGGIWINYPSHSSSIEHTIIKNATVGVYCDTASGDQSKPNVTIKKSFIRNMNFDGVAGRYATIEMENSIVTNCGRFTFLGSFGGDYDIRNSTFYMDSRDFSRSGPTFAYLNINRDEFNQILSTHPIQFNFVNNIIYGTNSDGEIGNDLDASKIELPSVVDYNLLNTLDAAYSAPGSSNIVDQDPLFLDDLNLNFDLDTLSPAKDAGFNLVPAITDDYCDRIRTAAPDLGAFESQY